MSRTSSGADRKGLRLLGAAVAAFAVIGGVELVRLVLIPSLPGEFYLLQVGSARSGVIASCPPSSIGQALAAGRLAAPGLYPGGSVLAKQTAAVSPGFAPAWWGPRSAAWLLTWPSLPPSLLQVFRSDTKSKYRAHGSRPCPTLR